MWRIIFERQAWQTTKISLAIAAVFQRGLQARGIDRDLHAGTFLLQKHGGR